MVLGFASIVSGALFVILLLTKPKDLLQDFLISFGVFVLSLGISAVCVVRGTDIKIN